MAPIELLQIAIDAAFLPYPPPSAAKKASSLCSTAINRFSLADAVTDTALGINILWTR